MHHSQWLLWTDWLQISVLKVIRCTISVLLILSPFLWHQYMAYQDFCKPMFESSASPPWCSDTFPSIYSYVQSKYWDSGLLKYWTLQQLPNFIISAPVLALLLYTSAQYVAKAFLPQVRESMLGRPAKQIPKSPFNSASIAPHALHALIFTCMLLFAAHTADAPLEQES